MRRLLLLVLLTLPVLAAAAEPVPLVRLGSDRFRQQERVSAITYSADGKRLATADENRVHIWDATDGRLLHTMSGPEKQSALALRFGPDGSALYVATVTDKKGVVLRHLDPATGKELAAMFVSPDDKERLFDPDAHFSSDGTRLAVLSAEGGRLRVIDPATRTEAWSEQLNGSQYRSVRFRAGGKSVALGGEDGRVEVIDLATRTVVHRCQVTRGIVWSLTFAPDGTDLVAVVSNPGPNRVIRFEAATGKLRWTFEAERSTELGFTPDGKALRYWGKAAGDRDTYRWHWLDSATGKPLPESMDTGYWHEAAVRPDGRVIALGGLHGHVSQWDLTTRKRLDAASADPDVPVTELDFTVNGAKVQGWAHGWYEWDVRTGKQTRLSPSLENAGFETAVGSFDSRWLVFGSDTFVLAEIGTRNRRTIGAGADRFRFSRANRLIVNRDSGLETYDPSSAKMGEPLVHIEADEGAVAASADGTIAVRVSPSGDHFHGTRWDLNTGKPTGEWDGRLADPTKMNRSRGWRAELSADGRVLAVFFMHLAFAGIGFNDILELHTALFDARTGRYLSGWWDLHAQADLAFSADGRTVAYFYRSGLGVDIREVATGERRMRRSNPPVSSACFNPDGGTLALATSPGPVVLWDLIGKPTRTWTDEKPGNLWDGLASENAELSFDVIRYLRQHPTEAVPFLKERMKVPTAPAADWIAARIKLLDAAQFRDREKATTDLAGVGEVIVPELRAAHKTASPEARRRLDGLLEQATAPTRETWRSIRACEALEGIGTTEARELLAKWAKGPSAATLTREAAESFERLAKRGRS
jgi:WD40 repeat protein